MSTVDAVSFSREAYINRTSESYTKKELDKNAFLSLLVAQMRYQDPMKPMEDTAFVAQLAQFSSLEQLSNMSTAFLQMQSTNLIGKTIYAETTVDIGNGTLAKREVAGVVESAGIKEGNPYVIVGGVEVKVSEIKQVFDTNAVFLNYEDVLKGASLVGRYVVAEFTDAEGNNVKLGGTVERLIVEEGQIKLKIKDYDYTFSVSGIKEIAETGEPVYEVTPMEED